jgi:hypothetical protein
LSATGIDDGWLLAEHFYRLGDGLFGFGAVDGVCIMNCDSENSCKEFEVPLLSSFCF